MIIADTGFFIALGNRNDQDHRLAIKVLNSLNEPIITTYPVITETCYLLSARAGHSSQCNFLRELANVAFEVFELQRRHVEQMVVLMERYADLPMDMADASLVVLAEHLEDGRILTADRRDFSVYRWHNNKPFDNLLR
jgi:uncharacterized protein